LALVGIRKAMDYIFTQKELSYLDDIIPEHVKRCKEDGNPNSSVPEDLCLKGPNIGALRNRRYSVIHTTTITTIIIKLYCY
jgi:hypothetical protein